MPNSWRLMIATSCGATGPVITADIRPEDVPAILEIAKRRMHEYERMEEEREDDASP